MEICCELLREIGVARRKMTGGQYEIGETERGAESNLNEMQ